MFENINYLLVFIVSIVQFIVGAIWYMPIFGNLWGKIHGFEQLNPEVQSEMQKSMLPYLFTQFVMTFITNLVLIILIRALKESPLSIIMICFLVWIGFVATTQVVGVIFGGDKKEWMLTKIGIMVSHEFVNFMIAGAIFQYFLK